MVGEAERMVGGLPRRTRLRDDSSRIRVRHYWLDERNKGYALHRREGRLAYRSKDTNTGFRTSVCRLRHRR